MAKTMRIQMLVTKSEEVAPGSFVTYTAGDFYLLPVKTAEKWIAAGEAIDPDAPPVAEEPKEEPPAEKGGDS